MKLWCGILAIKVLLVAVDQTGKSTHVAHPESVTTQKGTHRSATLCRNGAKQSKLCVAYDT